MADWKNVAIADLERQIAELRANLDAATDLQTSATRAYAEQCEEIETLVAENAQLRALPLKDEVERVLEPFADIAGEAWADENGWTVAACPNDRIRDWFGPSAFRAARTLLSRLRAGEQKQDGLSEWAGWDKSHDPWGETKHKDAVLEALFRGPWSVEDAATLIGFIDRTWIRRPAAPKQGEAKEVVGLDAYEGTITDPIERHVADRRSRP